MTIIRLVDGDGDQARRCSRRGPPAPRRGMPRRIRSAESIARMPFSIQSLVGHCPGTVRSGYFRRSATAGRPSVYPARRKWMLAR